MIHCRRNTLECRNKMNNENKTRNRVTPSQIKRIKELSLKGYSHSAISSMLSLKIGTVRYYASFNEHYPSRIPNNLREEVIYLHQKGKTYREICRATGLSLASIGRVVATTVVPVTSKKYSPVIELALQGYRLGDIAVALHKSIKECEDECRAYAEQKRKEKEDGEDLQRVND